MSIINSLPQSLINAVDDALFNFAQLDSFWLNTAIAFGSFYDIVKATTLQNQWQNRDFRQLPEIEILSSSILGNASGAYALSTNKIYLSDSFLTIATTEAIKAVILEEIGHYVDSQINQTDSPGDEGAIFASLVLGNTLSETEINQLKIENDQAIVIIQGQPIQIEMALQTPTNITISNGNIAENLPIGTVIGNFITTDPDIGDTFTYSLVAGTGDTNNTSFTIQNNQLKANASFNFEAKNSYSIRVKTTDQDGLSFEKQLTIGITNVNEVPTNLTLSNSTVNEKDLLGVTIGNFTSSDPDTGNTFTYSLVSGTGDANNSLFTIQNNQLKANTIFDYETKNSYSIRVRTTDQGGLSFEKNLIITINNTPDPIITNPINNIVVGINAADTTLNLTNYFDDPLTTGQIAHFNLANTSAGTIGNGVINVVLFDQNGIGAPLTVGNFKNYAKPLSNSYDNSFIHRSIPNFIIQGGGFTYNNSTLGTIATNAPVQNEFSLQRSNLRGTIAMAKVGNDPNSATDQWFFNLADNSSNLNNQNGGFTAFGRAISANDLTTIDAIAAVKAYDASSGNINSPFTNLPLTQPVISDTNFIRFSSITVTQEEELQFAVISNSKPTLLTPSIVNKQLILDYLPNQTGNANLTIRATNLLGEFVDYSFTATVLPTITLTATLNSVAEDNNNNLVYTFTRNGDLTNSLTVNYAISGTAINGIDYATIGTSINFAANSNTATLTITPNADTIVEPDETVALNLVSSTDYTIGTTNIVTETITNDDLASLPDFNSDGNTDLLWQNPTTGQVAYWYMNNSTLLGGVIAGSAPLEWKVAGTGDFNQDGNTDLLWQNPTTGQVAYWYMNNSTLLGGVIAGSPPLEWKVAGTGDFNKDGKDDLLWQNTATGQVGYWYMDNTNQLGSAIIGSAPLEWKVAGTGDFNKDGKDDLLWQNSATGQVGYWYMDNSSLLGTAIAGSAPLEWKVAGTGDFNKDGKDDLLWQNTATGQVGYWYMDNSNILGNAIVGSASGWNLI